jgi:hypothetical protein
MAVAHFVLNGSHFSESVYPFYRALRHMGFLVQPVNQVSCENDDPVDCFICERLDECLRQQQRGERQDVSIVSHDRCYAPVLAKILQAGGRVNVYCFREELSPDLLSLESLGAVVVDLEHDVGAFLGRLRRPWLPLYSTGGRVQPTSAKASLATGGATGRRGRP